MQPDRLGHPGVPILVDIQLRTSFAGVRERRMVIPG
jgi:hypothetical protein